MKLYLDFFFYQLGTIFIGDKRQRITSTLLFKQFDPEATYCPRLPHIDNLFFIETLTTVVDKFKN